MDSDGRGRMCFLFVPNFLFCVGEIPEVQNILASSDRMSYVPCINVRPDKVWIRA